MYGKLVWTERTLPYFVGEMPTVDYYLAITCIRAHGNCGFAREREQERDREMKKTSSKFLRLAKSHRTCQCQWFSHGNGIWVRRNLRSTTHVRTKKKKNDPTQPSCVLAKKNISLHFVVFFIGSKEVFYAPCVRISFWYLCLWLGSELWKFWYLCSRTACTMCVCVCLLLCSMPAVIAYAVLLSVRKPSHVACSHGKKKNRKMKK